MPLPEYEVFAIKYGDRVGTRGTIFANGDPHEAPLPMDYFVWVIRNSQRTVVLDIGFSQAEGERRGRNFLRCPTDGMKLIGVDADAVEGVIISHMHYDHVGNLDLFPKAKFHIQDEEMSFVTGRAMTHLSMRGSFVLSEVVQMLTAVYGDRVIFHDGDEEIFPGVWVHHMPGHTRGLQSVRVHTKRGWIILASDAAHYYESLTDGTPFLLHENMFQMLEGFRRLRKLVSSGEHIVPGHDPDVLRRYGPPSPDLDGIVVRLDEPPKA
ncbi:MAG: N-acyl homoserine lactonase family protein [Rhodospirillaceae bacterium]|jgi:glyoxylase-like metal-dependent hydrolase (beta-lactamase superfamily II)|nr:N-acyl homoserine lactonase family protein [Rhodospirillaceae bacterium]MBT5191232.1 N-acyl homoserine lactonase family protein [Rhodospirillaceae bacterium]MBT5897396.1 N-acyl homoserine lactonase family protein [Rhodospirillaceae bacterium]MBT6429061.1 N-acyl homoserine lactonase family protein [Rhodospirillaceae bacterium]MBT7755838.1 N-acyl homoserine lactonase family protein [Rhodospirillaceae bacterium]